MVYNLLEQNNKQSQTLVSPEQLAQEFPVSPEVNRRVETHRSAVKKILAENDPRLLVILGPCSIHDTKAALEYASLFKKASDCFADDLLLVMRTYFEKPRTTVGWKGLLSDPHLDSTFDINHGLKLARSLLLKLNELSIPTATEFLDTIIPQYLSELITWTAIGARTSESQIHRELASGLMMPVGFKNTTDGNIKIAVDAVHTAQHPHQLLTIDKKGLPCAIYTNGNPDCHIILRGSHLAPNYTDDFIRYATQLLANNHLRPQVMIDCSHGNSMKTYQNQCVVADSVAEKITQGTKTIFGVMIESNLVAGQQRLEKNQPLTYGQSITDACISWDETLPLLDKLAQAVRKRKTRMSQKSSLQFI